MSEQQPWGRKVLVITDRLVASCSSLVFHVVAEILELTGPELVEGSSHGRASRGIANTKCSRSAKNMTTSGE